MEHPIKMTPAIVKYIWGEESWCISTHLDGLSVVSTGGHTGKTLRAVIGELPVLIKIIHANDKLSVQVHPDDLYGRSVERQAGKNEMWYIQDAEPGAEVILGLKEPISKNELRSLIERDTLMDAVNRVAVKPGECYTVPTGLIHAIGEGITVIEVQQPSNVTYRLYDYGRTDAQGNKRELHIDKALDVVDTAASSKKADSDVLVDWEYFRCEKITAPSGSINTYTLTPPVQEMQGGGFDCLVTAQGEVVLLSDDGKINLNAGDSVLLPRNMKNYTIKAESDAVMLLVS